VEQKAQKNHQAEADTAGNHASLDLLETFLFRCPLSPRLNSRSPVFHPCRLPVISLPDGCAAFAHHASYSAEIDATLGAMLRLIAGFGSAGWAVHGRFLLYLESSCGGLLCGKCLVSSSVTLSEGLLTGSSSVVRGAAGSTAAGAEKTGCGFAGLREPVPCGWGAGVLAARGGRELIIFEIPTASRTKPIKLQKPKGDPP